jgi:hypothetical protein
MKYPVWTTCLLNVQCFCSSERSRVRFRAICTFTLLIDDKGNSCTTAFDTQHAASFFTTWWPRQYTRHSSITAGLRNVGAMGKLNIWRPVILGVAWGNPSLLAPYFRLFQWRPIAPYRSGFWKTAWTSRPLIRPEQHYNDTPLDSSGSNKQWRKGQPTLDVLPNMLPVVSSDLCTTLYIVMAHHKSCHSHRACVYNYYIIHHIHLVT